MGGFLFPVDEPYWSRGFINFYLKLIDNQQHTQHEFHRAKLKLSTVWISVLVYKDETEHLDQVYKCIVVNFEDCKAGP